MKTRITELLEIEHPIILSGMSWISIPEMVAAVSNAGGLGLLATGALNAEETRASVKRIRELTDKPFGANASLLFPGAAQNAAVLLEEKVPVINFSLGKGDWIVNAANEYGGKVLATVTNVRHAKRAQDYGSHGVIVTGNEAAAHGEPPLSAWSPASPRRWRSRWSPRAAWPTEGGLRRCWPWEEKAWPWARG
jgi:enoyl-[acyl-carrier protein] reductase II